MGQQYSRQLRQGTRRTTTASSQAPVNTSDVFLTIPDNDDIQGQGKTMKYSFKTDGEDFQISIKIF